MIAAETLGGTRNSHAEWLYLLLRTPLQSALPTAEITWASFEKEAVQTVDFVIGFELSDVALTFLDETGMPFLDLRIHPVRFLDDIFFAFQTNVPSVHEQLLRYRLDETLCRWHADMIKATVIKLKKRKIVAPDSLLLIGQTEADRVVYDGKKHLSLLDRLESIKSLSEEHDQICFKPHPYARTTRVMLRELRKALGNVRVVRDNVYFLLADDGVQHVAALNSSVLHEAEHFGKTSTFLFKPTFDERHVGIYGDFLNAAFWSDVLSSVLPTVPTKLQLPFQPGRMRRALNDFWGYNAVGDEIVLNDILKGKIKHLLSFWR